MVLSLGANAAINPGNPIFVYSLKYRAAKLVVERGLGRMNSGVSLPQRFDLAHVRALLDFTSLLV